MAYIQCQNLSVGYAGETLIENINFEGANAVWDNINWSIGFKSVTSNNIECNVTLNDDIKEVYGETIQTLYKNI